MIDKELFQKYIKELNDLYDKNPRKATDLARENLVALKIEESKQNGENIRFKFFKDLNPNVYVFAMCALILILLGIFNANIGMYIFGIVFFIAGYFVGTRVSKIGLIFLFSHGLTGFGVMIASFFVKSEFDVFSTTLLSDMSLNMKAFIIIFVLMSIFATLTAVICNLSDNFKLKKYSYSLPMIMYTIAILMAAVFSRLYL